MKGYDGRVHLKAPDKGAFIIKRLLVDLGTMAL